VQTESMQTQQQQLASAGLWRSRHRQPYPGSTHASRERL